MNRFLEKHLGKVLNSAGLLGILQIVTQIGGYLSNSLLTDPEMQKIFLSATSTTQTIIVIIFIVYIKYLKK